MQKKFKDYKITCIQSNLPLGLESLLGLKILNGGLGCDSVGLHVKVGRLIVLRVGVNIYGIKVSPNHKFDQSCDQMI